MTIMWSKDFTLGLLCVVSTWGLIAAYCEPGNPCWPSPEEWQEFNTTVQGHLACPANHTAQYVFSANMVYPNWQHELGHTNSPLALPVYAVAATEPADVVAAVKFAAAHHIRLSVKSTGHSYTGRSTAADSLLVSLRDMQQMKYRDSFDDGCGTPATPAVTVEPGVTFGKLYPFVDRFDHVVVGGGGPSVSAGGGYMHGGGHSPVGRALGMYLVL